MVLIELLSTYRLIIVGDQLPTRPAKHQLGQDRRPAGAG